MPAHSQPGDAAPFRSPEFPHTDRHRSVAASSSPSESLAMGGLPLMKSTAELCILSLLILGCHQQERIEPSVSPINNTNVYWVVDSCGALPYIRDSVDFDILDATQISDECLLERLSDPDAWIAAHVILTRRYVHTLSGGPLDFNNLKVHVTRDKNEVDPSQRSKIQRQWLAYFKDKSAPKKTLDEQAPSLPVDVPLLEGSGRVRSFELIKDDAASPGAESPTP